MPVAAPAHGPIDASLERASREIAEQPEDQQRWAHRAELHRVHEDWAAAHADLDRAEALAPDWPDLDFYRARLLLDQGEAAGAEQILGPWTEVQPSHAAAQALRGRALAELGRGRAAAQAYTRAIRIRANAGLYLARARALGAEDLATALASLDEGIAALGPNPALVRTAIELELARGDFEGALQRIQSQIEAPGRRDPWLVERGEILERAGRGAEAAQAFEAALAAIHVLPEARRLVPATRQLEARSNAGLARLGDQSL